MFGIKKEGDNRALELRQAGGSGSVTLNAADLVRQDAPAHNQ